QPAEPAAAFQPNHASRLPACSLSALLSKDLAKDVAHGTGNARLMQEHVEGDNDGEQTKTGGCDHRVENEVHAGQAGRGGHQAEAADSGGSLSGGEACAGS